MIGFRQTFILAIVGYVSTGSKIERKELAELQKDLEKNLSLDEISKSNKRFNRFDIDNLLDGSYTVRDTTNVAAAINKLKHLL